MSISHGRHVSKKQNSWYRRQRHLCESSTQGEEAPEIHAFDSALQQPQQKHNFLHWPQHNLISVPGRQRRKPTWFMSLSCFPAQHTCNYWVTKLFLLAPTSLSFFINRFFLEATFVLSVLLNKDVVNLIWYQKSCCHLGSFCKKTKRNAKRQCNIRFARGSWNEHNIYENQNDWDLW